MSPRWSVCKVIAAYHDIEYILDNGIVDKKGHSSCNRLGSDNVQVCFAGKEFQGIYDIYVAQVKGYLPCIPVPDNCRAISGCSPGGGGAGACASRVGFSSCAD